MTFSWTTLLWIGMSLVMIHLFMRMLTRRQQPSELVIHIDSAPAPEVRPRGCGPIAILVLALLFALWMFRLL